MVRRLIICFLVSLVFGCSSHDSRLAKASRSEQDGWIKVRLAGSPSEIGFQHGYLLADEIDAAMKMFRLFLRTTTEKEWDFFRTSAQQMFWPKLGKEYQEEIAGIAEGVRARGASYDEIDITAMNGWMELTWYYIPHLANRAKADSLNNRAPGNCSAFIANGRATSDGAIVMAHNTWMEYFIGQRWNIAMEIVPATGHRIFMDAFPGFIHSGDDFAMNDAGMLITETTITGFKGFDEGGDPEFVRARRAAQYAGSIDEFVRIMSANNNGAYANTWLVGDTKTNEIAKFDLGLRNQRLWRTMDGIFVGANFGTDTMLLTQETTFKRFDKTISPNTRKARWEQLTDMRSGKIDIARAMALISDHVDVTTGDTALNRCVLCGHADKDPLGVPEWSNPPYYPIGATSGKVTTTALAKRWTFWGRIGHPCGEPFLAKVFLEAHPEYRWMEGYLRDMPTMPWTKLEGGKQ